MKVLMLNPGSRCDFVLVDLYGYGCRYCLFFERDRVAAKWKTSLTVAALLLYCGGTTST